MDTFNYQDYLKNNPLLKEDIGTPSYDSEVKANWSTFSDEQKIDLLTGVWDDSDEAEKHFEKEWDNLPEAAKANMRMDMLRDDIREVDVESGDDEYKYLSTKSTKTLGGEPKQAPNERLLNMERGIVHRVIRQAAEDMSSNKRILTREYIDEIINALEDLKTSDF